MRRLVFATQKLDPADPVLAATVPMARALAARVDELVVLCANVLGYSSRVMQFAEILFFKTNRESLDRLLARLAH